MNTQPVEFVLKAEDGRNFGKLTLTPSPSSGIDEIATAKQILDIIRDLCRKTAAVRWDIEEAAKLNEIENECQRITGNTYPRHYAKPHIEVTLGEAGIKLSQMESKLSDALVLCRKIIGEI